MRQEKQTDDSASGQLLAEMILLTYRAGCLSVEAFLHEGFGATYVRSGPMGLFAIYLFLGEFPADDPRPLTLYGIAFLALWANGQFQSIARKWRGKPPLHRLYGGRPFLMRLLPRWHEETVKQVELVPVGLLGLAVSYANRPLGDYLMLASTMALLRTACAAASLHQQAAELNDLTIEQKSVARRFRAMQEQ